jgi:hypothetical protein
MCIDHVCLQISKRWEGMHLLCQMLCEEDGQVVAEIGVFSLTNFYGRGFAE